MLLALAPNQKPPQPAGLLDSLRVFAESVAENAVRRALCGLHGDEGREPRTTGSFGAVGAQHAQIKSCGSRGDDLGEVEPPGSDRQVLADVVDLRLSTGRSGRDSSMIRRANELSREVMLAHNGAKVVAPDSDAEWLTQGEAAALSGLPLTMIEWWCWSKKVQTRSRDLGPSVNRASLLAYIDEREARRDRPRPAIPPGQPRPPVEPPSPELIGVREVAEILQRNPESVGRIVKQAGLVIERSNGRMWLRRDDVEALARDRSSWVSWADAAAHTGFSQSVIGQAVKAGAIEQRPVANRSLPGLSRTSVVAWAKSEGKRRAEAAARREAKRQRGEPPRDRHQWMRIGSAARVLGLSRSRVSQLVKEGRLPATPKNGKVWLRLDHVEQARRAREAKRLPSA